jgi:hypothetical protein
MCSIDHYLLDEEAQNYNKFRNNLEHLPLAWREFLGMMDSHAADACNFSPRRERAQLVANWCNAPAAHFEVQIRQMCCWKDYSSGGKDKTGTTQQGSTHNKSLMLSRWEPTDRSAGVDVDPSI